MSDTARYRIVERRHAAFRLRVEHRGDDGEWIEIAPALSEAGAEDIIAEHKQRRLKTPADRVVRYVD